MEDANPIVKWEDLDSDILVRILLSFNILERTSTGIPHVCRAWRVAACDPAIWKTLDLTGLKLNFIKTPTEPYVYVQVQSDKTVTRVLKVALSLSHGNTTALLFHPQLYLSDEQLTYAAERCPKLKRLVLPSYNRIRKTGLCKAIGQWPELESLTMPSIASPAYLMEEIAVNCPNFSELKVMGPFDIRCASALVEYLPSLKVLSLRCSIIFKNALLAILKGLQQLEILNISHSIILEDSAKCTRENAVGIEESTLEMAARLPKFIRCKEPNCLMCERTTADEGLVRWYKYEEGLWKADEVPSLAL
ncbi:unnamed protein product [Rhodiola kirilowii]